MALRNKRPGVTQGGQSNNGGQKPLLNLLQAFGSYDPKMVITPGAEAQGPPTAEGVLPEGTPATLNFAQPKWYNKLLDSRGVDNAENLKRQFDINQFLEKQQAAQALAHIQAQGGNARALEGERFGHEQVLGDLKTEGAIKEAQAKAIADANAKAMGEGYPDAGSIVTAKQPMLQLQAQLAQRELAAKLGIDPAIAAQATQTGYLADTTKQDALNKNELAQAGLRTAEARMKPYLQIPAGDAVANVDNGVNYYNTKADPAMNIPGRLQIGNFTSGGNSGGGGPVAVAGGVNAKINTAITTPPKVSLQAPRFDPYSSYVNNFDARAITPESVIKPIDGVATPDVNNSNNNISTPTPQLTPQQAIDLLIKQQQPRQSPLINPYNIQNFPLY